MTTQLEVRIHPTLADISQAEWDACACPETQDGSRPIDPFTTYRFISALEDSGSIGGSSGWHGRYLTVHSGEQTIAVAPLFAKSHSQGEYIFDFNWAQAYENAGGSYYPKLQMAVPFTPATGRRLLTLPGYEAQGQAALIQGAVQLASESKLSSLHITFCTEEEALAGEKIGLLRRVSQQFHWQNNEYADFDGFLASLAARKRKNIRRERATAKDFGGSIEQFTGEGIRPEHWDAFWKFYQDTGARKWGTPYLTRAFFDIAQETLRDDILLILALDDGRPVAGAFNMIGAETLFGRYWGCVEDHPALHFELCYYQAIDYAIANGLSRVEAGAQGEHKLARGYLPTQTHSLHWIADEGFHSAVAQYLASESEAIGEEIEYLSAFAPFKKNNAKS